MMDLRKQAESVGGKVVQLLGNHVRLYWYSIFILQEIMNLMDDLRYVSKEDTDSFGSAQKRVNCIELLLIIFGGSMVEIWIYWKISTNT